MNTHGLSRLDLTKPNYVESATVCVLVLRILPCGYNAQILFKII